MSADQVFKFAVAIAMLLVMFLLKLGNDALNARRRAKLGLTGQGPGSVGAPITSPFDWMLPTNPAYATREEQIVFEVARALLKLFWIYLKWGLIATVVGTVGLMVLVGLLQTL